MKLTIKRNQAVEGKKVQFSLFVKADLISEERALIDHYNVGDYYLASYEPPHISAMLDSLDGSSRKNLKDRFNLSVNSLVNGKNIELADISMLLELEGEIKKGCQNLKNLLLITSTFRGEEVIDI